jgi:hypothetical protein
MPYSKTMSSTSIHEQSLLELTKLSSRLRKSINSSRIRMKRKSGWLSLGSSGFESDIQTPKITSTTPSSRSIPKVQKALVVARKGEYEIRDDYPVPEFENEDEVMVRSCAVGLNPIDWKSVAYNFCLPQFPWVCPACAFSSRVRANQIILDHRT